MKLYDSQIFSSAIHPQQSRNEFDRKTQIGSQLGESVIGHNFNQVYESKSYLKSVTDQLYVKSPNTRKWKIIIGVLTMWLLASIGLNIYFGIKANNHPPENVVFREIKMNYFENCNDLVYEISVPNISGKRVVMNVTHWPECFIQKNFPKSGDTSDSIQTPLVNQLPPPSPLNNTNGPKPPLNNQTLLGAETDNLIYIQEHKVVILAWVYNSQ